MTNNEQMKTESNEFEKLASENMSSWLELVKSGDVDKISAMYTDDATFLPTVSGDFKRGKSGAKEYFEHFLAKNPIGKVVVEVVTPVDESSYLYSGMYNFELDTENGRSEVEARFSYFWKKVNGEWKINHHHSSLRPQS